MKTIDLAAHRRKRDTNVVYVGDTVEWRDYTGELIRGDVTRIEFRHSGGFSKSFAQELPLDRKEDYVVHFGTLSVIGSVVVQKLVKPGVGAARAKMARSQ